MSHFQSFHSSFDLKIFHLNKNPATYRMIYWWPHCLSVGQIGVSVGPHQGAKQEVVKLTKDIIPIPPIDTQNYEIKDHLTPKSFHQIIPHALRSYIPQNQMPWNVNSQNQIFRLVNFVSPLVTVERLPEMIVVACLLYCLWSEWQWTSTAWIYR